MPAQVITIERRKYATGLFWQPVADGQNVRAFARHISKLVPGHSKFFTEYRSMIGVGSRALGHRPGMPSAATEVMDAFADYTSFLAAFATKQGFWVVSGRNGIIVHDMLYSDEATAKAAFDKLAELPDWGIIVAPGYWAAARSQEKLLSDLASGDAKYSVQAVSNFGSGIMSFVIVAAILVGIFYVFKAPIISAFAPHPKKNKMDEAAALAYKQRLEERDNILIGRRENNAPVPLIMPFDSLPDPRIAADLCYAAIIDLMQVVPGWSAVTSECFDSVATAHLHRRFGVLSNVYTFVAANMPGVEITENSDSDIVLTRRLPALEVGSRLSESGGEEVARTINSVFQSMYAAAYVQQSVETVHGSDGRIESVNVVLVSATSSLIPTEFIKIFEIYDAVLLERVRWTSNARQWNYEVKIYVK